MSFSIESLNSVPDLEISASPLALATGTRLGADPELYVVHRWKQAGLGVFQSQPVEVDELLLKDDREPLRDGYIRACGAFHLHKSASRYRPPDVRLSGPVRTSIPAGGAKQFCVCVSVPTEAQPGSYSGSILARAANKTLLELALEIDVVDIDLVEPPHNQMLWYRGTINCHHPHHYVRKSVFRAQLEDIYKHGFRSLSLWETDARRLQEALDIAQSVGFAGDVVMDGFREPLWSRVNFGKLRPVAYVSDEIDAHAHRLEGHAAAMREAISSGVRTMASVLDWRTVEHAMTKASGIRPDVISIYAPENQSRLALHTLHSDHDSDVYYYWQAHMEKPLVHRLLAGLLLWKSGAQGISPYCYQHLPGFPYSPFDDFDAWDPSTHHDALGRHFKDHMATYPARRGVIHTLQWKGLADGLADLRYLATLNAEIERALNDENPSRRVRGEIARVRMTNQLDKVQWADIDIVSETSAEPYPDFGANDVAGVRESVMTELLELRHGTAVQQ